MNQAIDTMLPRSPGSSKALRWAAGVLVLVPWLNPFAPGPSPTVVPWLLSFACGTGLWLLAALAGAGIRWRVLVAAAALVGWGCVTHVTPPLDGFAWAGAVLLLVGMASVADDADLRSGAAAGAVAAATLSAAIALVQYFGASASLAPWISQAAVGEAYANLRQPNQFATLCAIGLALVVWSSVMLPRAARMVLVMLLAAGSAASVSRTGLLEAAALAVLAGLWRGDGRKDRVVLACTAGLAYLAASWVLPELLHAATGNFPARTLWGRLGGSGDACSSRTVLWANVLHLITLRPWTGWGLGELDYAHFMTLYDGPRFCDILDNAHNLPLQLAVELGLPAAILLSGGALAWTRRRRPWSVTQPRDQLAWALLAVIGLHSLLEYPLWYGPFQMTCGLALGLLTGARSRRSLPRLPVVGAAVLLFFALAYAAWDYARVSQIYLPASQRAAPWRNDPLAAAQRSWLFGGQAQFAALTLDAPSRANAAAMLSDAKQLLHYSPEPRVIERAIESAVLLRRDDEAMVLLARYRAAFPKEALAWSQRQHAAVQD